MENTFFNLPPQKRKKILDALRREFSSVPFAEAEVKKIIETAKIPRGSFYQYFKNLKEAYFYILDLYTLDTHQIFLDLLRKNNYDYENVFKEYGKQIANEVFDEEKKALYKFKFLYWTDELEKDYLIYKKISASSVDIKPVTLLCENEECMFIKAVVHDLIRRAFNGNWDKKFFLNIYNLHCTWMLGGLKNARNI